MRQVGTTQVVISLVTFYGIYIVLGAVNVYLMLRFARRGLELEPDEPDEPDDAGGPAARVPVLTY